MNDSGEKTACTNNPIAILNRTSFSDSPIRQCVRQYKRQRNKILGRILQAICQNRDINIYVQLMKLLNCNKKHKRSEDSLNCKIAIDDNTALSSVKKNKKCKDKPGNTLSTISQINKTRTTWCPSHITQFIEILGLSEQISKEKTHNSSFKITETNKNQSCQILKNKPLAFLETVLKVLKMKNYPELLLIIKPSQKAIINRNIRRNILQIAIRTKPKIQYKKNRMVELFKPKDIHNANKLVTKNNCFSEKSTHSPNSGDGDKCNYDLKKIADDHKEYVNPNKTQSASENSAKAEKDSRNTNEPVELTKFPKTPKKMIDLRSIKCSNNKKLDQKKKPKHTVKDIIVEIIKSNKEKSKPSSLSSVKLNEDTNIFNTSGSASVPGSSMSKKVSACYDINLTRSNYLQRKGVEPTKSVLTGPKYSLLCKRTNESDLGNAPDRPLAKRRSSGIDERFFDDNVILTGVPCSTEFNDVIEERIKDSQNMAIQMYKCRQDDDIKNEISKYKRCLSFLELKQRFELTSTLGNFMCCPIDRQISLHVQHLKQRRLLEQQLNSRLTRLENRFENLFDGLTNRQTKVLNVLNMDFEKNSLTARSLTLPLRKGPTRENKHSICYQQITAAPSIMITLLREDEVYDTFYSHRLPWNHL
ncbi:Hypothetical predicted protein [Octopus vulgaris]|uniref:Uncharacterized protein n=1 Tax=Octopus vulgaris TaxID=6645 RepID=A0AA36F008_OCTVU|nr:Hypothetical predicted protein [Octopus vulgaris]